MATPNMNLVELVPGVTTGPQYATDIVSNFSTIDDHDHTTGNGVRIPSAGININANLPFGGNAPTGQGKSQFNSLSAALSAAGDYRSVHVVNGELYYLDDSGNAVQLTSSGSVAGSAGNITGLAAPASVTFSTNKFVFKDTANSFAIMESSDVRLFEDSASAISNYVGLKSPSALASTYNLTFPAALPAADRYTQVNGSGTLSFVTADTVVDDATRTTGDTAGTRGFAIDSGNTGTFNATSTFNSLTNVIELTTSGRPVVFGFNAAVGARLLVQDNTSAGLPTGEVIITADDGVTQYAQRFDIASLNTTGSSGNYIEIPVQSIHGVLIMPANTYDFSITIQAATGRTINFDNAILYAYEIV